jgi:hypothetical protein
MRGKIACMTVKRASLGDSSISAYRTPYRVHPSSMAMFVAMSWGNPTRAHKYL